MEKRFPVPPAYCPGICMKHVSNPFPCPVVNITVAENHLLVRVFHPVNDGADLLFLVPTVLFLPGQSGLRSHGMQ